MTPNADSGGQGISPEFEAEVAKALAPFEDLIENMWERLDELAKGPPPNGRSGT